MEQPKMANVQMANLKTKLETRAPIDDNDCNARYAEALTLTGLKTLWFDENTITHCATDAKKLMGD